MIIWIETCWLCHWMFWSNMCFLNLSCSALVDSKQPSIAQAFKPTTDSKPKQRKLLTTKKPVLTISDDEEDDDVLISGRTLCSNIVSLLWPAKTMTRVRLCGMLIWTCQPFSHCWKYMLLFQLFFWLRPYCPTCILFNTY